MKRWCFLLLFPLLAWSGDKPMTFLDVLQMRAVGDGTLSQDGRSFAYTVSTLDWKAGRRFTDIHLTDTSSGAMRQLTYTGDKNETSPAFSPDGQWLAFSSNRDRDVNQVFVMALSGGEAKRISDVAGGASAFAFSPDGKYIAILAGRAGERQIHLHDVAKGETKLALKHATGIESMAWNPDSSSIYFAAPDEQDAHERKRMELRFDVKMVDAPAAPNHLWALTLADRKPRRLTSGGDFSVSRFAVAKSGGWISLLSRPNDRHEERVVSRRTEAWLLHAPTGKLERLTDNTVTESLPAVSPDGKWVAITAPDNFEYFRRTRIYLRPTAGGGWRKLPGDDWDYEVGAPEWSKDSERLYFDTGIGTTQQVFLVDVASGKLTQVTQGYRVANATYHPESDQFFVAAEDSATPRDYWLASRSTLGQQASWKRLSHANPQMAQFALGSTETIRWKSTDGKTIEGLLVKPIGYQPGKRYPLIVQIHGGPASADLHRFSASHGSYHHIWAAAGYVVMQPNYRGSTNYGEQFRTAIVKSYFPQAFDDIMTGVDALIAQGIADPDRMGMMGWSAGGHWSNWTLTHTNRFKAISSGAGASNWVSQYAQNDSQANREHYFGGKPYDNWDHWVEMSPIKHIRNAKTPTLIHVGDLDERVPRPQSQELHMGLKKMGVPTELIIYPRMGHGITEPRFQMVKMVSEFNWMEKWIRGKEKWFDWKELVEMVPGAGERPSSDSGASN